MSKQKKSDDIPSWFRQWSLIILVIVVFALVSTGIFSSINTFFGVPDDSPLEEFLEEVIEAQTGMEIDLTAESKE